MFERERVERFHPYERTYARNEKRRMEDESFNYHSEPELSYSDGDDDLEDFFGDESDMEVYGKRRPVRLNQFLLMWSYVLIFVDVELFFKDEKECLFAKFAGGGR